MLRAHRQAWCWQDEWHGLEISDIRRLEQETQRALAEKMALANETDVQTTGSIQKNKSKKLAKNASVKFEDNVRISNGQQDSASISSGDSNVSKNPSGKKSSKLMSNGGECYSRHRALLQ